MMKNRKSTTVSREDWERADFSPVPDPEISPEKYAQAAPSMVEKYLKNAPNQKAVKALLGLGRRKK
jgi:hypothetical protein